MPSSALPPWYALARHDMGIAEIEGPAHNPQVLAYFAEAGHHNVRDDETPWCAAAMCTWLERAGFASPKSLWARDFLKWGRPVRIPYEGCVVVFKRGDGGHVTNFVRYSADRTRILCCGGNQANRVCEQWYPVKNVLGFREPVEWRSEQPSAAPSPPAVPAQPPVYDYQTPDSWQTVVTDLRDNGSRTIAAADRMEMKAKGMQSAGIGAMVVSALMAVYEQTAPLLPILGLSAFGILVFAFAAWTIRDQLAIKYARADDHITGRHKGRDNVFENIAVGYEGPSVAIPPAGDDRPPVD